LGEHDEVCRPASPTCANFRVDTPASIRSITARVSGSRSAKKRRIARSVVSIRHTSGLPPTGGSVAATIDNLCASRLTHRRTSAGTNE
jgi:hypothetical protein